MSSFRGPIRHGNSGGPVVDGEELREGVIASLQRVDERSEAEEEAETGTAAVDPERAR